MLACRTCGQAHDPAELPVGARADCARCGAELARNPSNSLHRTAALAIAALILYTPANVFPILRIEQNGAHSECTVLGSVRLLANDGDYFVALIVLLASIVIPLIKLSGLLFLSATTAIHDGRLLRIRTLLYRGIEAIGKWAMLDVFVLAVLVSVVKLRGLATVSPGSGVFAFSLVVVFTLLAASSFDPRLIWRKGASTT